MRRTSLGVGFAIGLLLACDSTVKNGSNTPPTTPSPSPTTWTGTLKGATVPLPFETQTATIQEDGGVQLLLEGTASGQPASVLIDVPGGLKISIPPDDPKTPANEAQADVPIGSSGLNVSLDYTGDTYHATSGKLTFTAYGFNVGDKITGSASIGLVAIASSAGGATLDGTFDATVAAPTPTPSPTPKP